MVISKKIGKINNYKNNELRIEELFMTNEELEYVHKKIKLENGKELALSLDIGESLEEGDVIYKDNQMLLVIALKKEDVVIATPKDKLEWALTAFNLGNMHCSAFINEDHIVVPYDYVIENMLNKLGVNYKRGKEKITGVKAKIKASAHRHSHSHSHVSQNEG